MLLENENILEKKKDLIYNKLFKCESKIRNLKEIKEIVKKEKDNVMYVIKEETNKDTFISVINQNEDILFNDFLIKNNEKLKENNEKLIKIFKNSKLVICFDTDYFEGGLFFNHYYYNLYENKVDEMIQEMDNLYKIKYKFDLAKEFMIIKDTLDSELNYYVVPSLSYLLEEYKYNEIVESACDVLFGLKHCIDSGIIDQSIKHFEQEKDKIELLFIEVSKQLERIRLDS